jgi:class 3 adenylate cyclase/tetratricopeptide (TPR) repeat protein
MSSALEQIEAAIAALNSQRAVLGDAVVDTSLDALKTTLASLNGAPLAPAKQLKQVTILFLDFVGSTALTQRLDPEETSAVLDGALERCSQVVDAHGGRVLQYAGDNLLAAFGVDKAAENDPEQAVLCGLALLELGRSLAREVQIVYGDTEFNVRVGVHTGDVLLGGGVDEEGTIRGVAVHVAARMEQSAPSGGMRISHGTYSHVRGVFDVVEQPPLAIKGLDEPLITYLVMRAKPRAFRVRSRGIEGIETRMVAREDELDGLRTSFRAICLDGRPSVIHVVGEAGLGKSRLIGEFEDWAEAQPERIYYIRARCSPQTQARPFGLLRDALAFRFEIEDSDDAETAARKLVAGIEPLFEDEGQMHAHLLGQLIGLDLSGSPHLTGILQDARQLKGRAFYAALQFIRNAARRNQTPVMFALDDLQWADEGSLDFIEYLIESSADIPLMLICMMRPSLYERRPGWKNFERAGMRIELEPLDKQASRDLASELLCRLDDVPSALRELLTDSAEGNPFYMEELVRMLIDDGAILTRPDVTRRDRWQVVPTRLLALHVPPTLTGVLQARIDGLSVQEKLALQRASVIGVIFWEQALAALDAAAAASLAGLIQRGMVQVREHASLTGHREFSFSHQLLHQVVYASVIKADRVQGHARVAAWLAQFAGDRGVEVLGPTAEHYAGAGDAINASEFFTRAAEAAAARFENESMLKFVDRARSLVDDADLKTRWRLALVRESYLRHIENRQAHDSELRILEVLSDRADDDAWRAETLLRRAHSYRLTGDFEASETSARAGLELVRLSPAAAPKSTLLKHSLAVSLLSRGDFIVARQVAEDGLSNALSHGSRSEESTLINTLGLIAMEQGELTKAVDHFERGLTMVRELGNRGAEIVRLINLGAVYPRLGDYERAREHLRTGLHLARAMGQRINEAAVLLNTASVAHLQGFDAEAFDFARAALVVARACGQPDLEAYSFLVEGHADLGLMRIEAARVAYSESHRLLLRLKMRSQQVLDPVSGLARVALAQERLGEAMEHAEAIYAHVSTGGSFDGSEEPLIPLLTCYRVFATSGDPRAIDVLKIAHDELHTAAARIDNPDIRHRFLRGVPHNREIDESWLSQSRISASGS